MKHFFIAALLLMELCVPAGAMSRIKDISDVEGIRENQLVGYGLVMGLAGTGDTMRGSPFTEQSARSMLQRLCDRLDAWHSDRRVSPSQVGHEICRSERRSGTVEAP